jgi:hypothetical protein
MKMFGKLPLSVLLNAFSVLAMLPKPGKTVAF